MPYFKSYLFSFVFCSLLVGGSVTVSAQNPGPSAQLSLGSIDFPTSATGKAQQEFLTGVLALHSFWYPEARDHFKRAQELKPSFAMAYWGEAITHDHPLWGQHNQVAGAKALKKLDLQLKTGEINWTEREKAYIDAIRILYDAEQSMPNRRRQYANAMHDLYEEYPSDETLAFSALAAMTTPDYDYDNPAPEQLVPIAAKLEQLYKRNPEHPGGMHYLIHLYDNDTYAQLGLRPARDYSQVAYSSSHAIHMPSHIFKQLEMWDKVIQANIRAYEASVEWQQKTNRPLKDRDFHSYRWLFEAYLEINDHGQACRMITQLQELYQQAKQRNEDPGRIPSLIDNLTSQYQNSDNPPTCTE